MRSRDRLPGLKSRRLRRSAARLLPSLLRWSLDSLPVSVFPDAPGLRAPARLYLERPGKMLRPLAAALILEGLGKRAQDFSAALGAIELMEAATVSFDDIIDGSDMRRGGPATHVLHGVPLSFLAFQAAYARSYAPFLSAQTAVESWRREYILATLSREIFAYGYGQSLELYWTARRRRPSPEAYLAMSWDRIRFLSFNGPFRIGALLGGCARRDLALFEKAGAWLGMAYHLRGDELNLFPASERWGKIPADDVTGGRYTYLYLKAMELSGRADRAVLAAALGDRGISPAALKNVIDIIRASGAVEANRTLAARFFSKAEAAIRALPVKVPARALLADLGRYMAYDRTK